MSNPFRYFNSSPEVIRLVVMMYVRYPLSLRNVEDLLAERGIDISHETTLVRPPQRSLRAVPEESNRGEVVDRDREGAGREQAARIDRRREE
jgi:transposase-like protein